jgi:hypothetical protein
MNQPIFLHQFLEECAPENSPSAGPTGTMTKTATVEGEDQDYANTAMGSTYTAIPREPCYSY